MDHYSHIIKNRRSYYVISNTCAILDTEIQKLLEEALLHSPTAFNMQGGRIVLLLGEKHKQLWSIATETLKKIVPADAFGPTETKIRSFANGYGTILFFDDTSVTNDYGEKFSLYKDNFPIWAQQANAILQYNVWNLLEQAGLGASLQHYNPLINNQVREAFGLPEDWLLIAQMPFGNPTAQPAEKEFLPIEGRLKILK